MSDWNPRYLAYCRANKFSDPYAMLEHDRTCYPGGHMTGFVLWIQANWAQFAKIRPEMNPEIKTTADHAAFDAWLDGAYP